MSCGTVGATLLLLNHLALSSLFIWQNGSLAQIGWAPSLKLIAEFIVLGSLLAPLVRPLNLLALDEGQAKHLAVPVNRVRAAAIGIAVALSAFVVSTVGVIGFIGLAAPALSRLLCARTFPQRLLWTPVLGALILVCADQSFQICHFTSGETPTGAATGLLAAPLLIWLLPRINSPFMRGETAYGGRGRTAPRRMGWALLIAGAMFLAAILIALFVGETPEGWHIANLTEFHMLARWRAPRVAGAAASGAMLAIAGGLMQRMTGNPMASPEVLGVSSGAAIGVIGLMLFVPGFGAHWLLLAAAAGAFLSLVLLLFSAKRAAFSPEKLLLSGIALATFMTAASSILLSLGDPRTGNLLTWMSGSTYGVTSGEAMAACFIALFAIAPCLLFGRWLEILPLGRPTAQAVGVSAKLSRFLILIATAILTAAATLIVGPLSFVGLIAPHMVRMAGIERPTPQLLGTAVTGALIMTLADWLGRNILFPWQIPAGLIAALIGSPYFLWLMRRR